jgi:TRAP-type C4-dicarboxylate transport system permease small subunit
MESAQYLNVWAMLLAGVGICAMGAHMRINALEEALKGRWRTINRVAVSAVTIAFTALRLWRVLAGHQVPAEHFHHAFLKMALVYWMLPVCGVLSALSAGLDLLVRLRWGDAAGEHEDKRRSPDDRVSADGLRGALDPGRPSP